MRNSDPCPKCGSRDIVRVPGAVGPYGVGNNISVSWTGAVKVTRYICALCGFSEEWIDSPEDLAKIKKKYGS